MRGIRRFVDYFPRVISVAAMLYDCIDMLLQDPVKFLGRPAATCLVLKIEPRRRLHVAIHQAMPHEFHVMLPGETHRLVHRVEIEMSALRFSEVRENDRDSRIKLAPHNWLVSRVAIPHPALNGRANPEPHRLRRPAPRCALWRR